MTKPHTLLDIEALKKQFLNREFDERKFNVSADAIVTFARACGEMQARYTDPKHPDFQAPPTFCSQFTGGRQLPEDYPRFGGIGMDAGKAIEPKAPIRAGTVLTGKSHLHDIYTKTGRSGTMVFTVLRMEFYDPAGTHVATADTRMVVRERPQE
jgi:hypothetical protein